MAHYIDLPTYSDPRGKLTVAQDVIPFRIERIYYIYQAIGQRGGHRHKQTIQALVCVSGSCEIYVNNGKTESVYVLNDPRRGLILEKEDWHTMDKFSDDCILLVMASRKYDVNDYIDEPY